MSLKMLSCFVLVAIPLIASAGQPVPATLEEALKHQADGWDVAIVNKDRDAIAANMADSFMQIDSDGATASKKQFIEDIVSDDLTISPYTVEDFRVRIFGNTALLTGTTDMHGLYKNKVFKSHYRYTDVYVKDHGKWKVINVQTTRIK